jgi:peptidoglycan/xylan/chitin deacetylase (PgdA/CDA1 family)
MYIKKKVYKIKKRFWNKLSILCYHRIEDYDADPVNITVSTKNFLKHVEWLKKSTNIISPKDFEDVLINRKDFPKRSVMLTFDDGYSSYFDTMKYLNRESIKALFFISTPSKTFFWDTLKNILIIPSIIKDDHYKLLCETFKILKIKINIEKSLDVKSIKIIKKWKISNSNYPFERCRAFSILANILEQENSYLENSLYSELKPLSSNAPNLKNIFKNSKITNYHSIGCHTSNHFNLSMLSQHQQKIEIEQNKKKLEMILNKNIDYFAYPYGTREHYNKESISLIKKRFKLAFSNFTGKIHKDSNHFELPRFLVRDWDIQNFKVKIENIFES